MNFSTNRLPSLNNLTLDQTNLGINFSKSEIECLVYELNSEFGM